jgi:hypothetical protein
VQDADQDQHQSAPNNYDYLLTIVSDDESIVLDVWIAIEKLVSPAEDENAAKQKNDRRESERDAQRRNASLFNHRHHKETVRLHAKRVQVISIPFYDASVGFSDATEEVIATPSSEIARRRSGTAPKSAAIVVIMMGRKRMRHAS